MGQANSRPDPAFVLAPGDILAGAGELGLELTESQAAQLARFAALLVRWNTVHNLTAIETPASVLSHHLLDSLAIVPVIDRIFGDRRARILDVGAGGGLPGIPLAVALPQHSFTLVDKVEKKAAFLTQVRVELRLPNVDCVQARVEALQSPPFDLIVSRAFASLDEFVRVTRHLLAPGGWWAAMKGVVPRDEIRASATAFPDVRVADIATLDVPRLGAERHLILLQTS